MNVELILKYRVSYSNNSIKTTIFTFDVKAEDRYYKYMWIFVCCFVVFSMCMMCGVCGQGSVMRTCDDGG